jgi:hypothetical protein
MVFEGRPQKSASPPPLHNPRDDCRNSSREVVSKFRWGYFRTSSVRSSFAPRSGSANVRFARTRADASRTHYIATDGIARRCRRRANSRPITRTCKASRTDATHDVACSARIVDRVDSLGSVRASGCFSFQSKDADYQHNWTAAAREKLVFLTLFARCRPCPDERLHTK